MLLIEKINTTGKLSEGKLEGVKLLGLISKNKRKYNYDVVKENKDKYVGKYIYCNHSDGKRKVEDKWGQIEKVEMKEDGLYGDIDFLETHPMTPRIKESIEKNKNYFGMSHSAKGNCKSPDKDGYKEVYEIGEIISVDIVDNSATTNGLFEEYIQEEVEEEVQEDILKSLLERVEKLEEEIKETKLFQEELKENKKVEKKSYIRSEPLQIIKEEKKEKSLKSYFIEEN